MNAASLLPLPLPPLPESVLIRLGVFFRLEPPIRVVVFVYFSRRELVVCVPFSRPVVAEAFDEVDEDEDEDAPVMFALGEIDDDDRSVTCWFLKIYKWFY